MQREGERRNDSIFDVGDSFGFFRGFGMRASPFGRRDPFDDPFFSRPFESFFESPSFAASDASHKDGAGARACKDGAGVLIQQLDSDDETDAGSGDKPSVEHPDDDLDAKEKSENVNHRNDYNRVEGSKPQSRNFSFQTCKVTYGGVDGAYYTSTRTRRAGNNGVIVEESKEADKTTGQATHRISRGINDKGHSVTRKLNLDGKVDTMQTLHNLNEDELAGFEESWKGNVNGQGHGWGDQFGMHGTTGSTDNEQKGMTTWGGWTFPSAEQSRNVRATSAGKPKKVVRINIE